jgi:hypothetical protein
VPSFLGLFWSELQVWGAKGERLTPLSGPWLRRLEELRKAGLEKTQEPQLPPQYGATAAPQRIDWRGFDRYVEREKKAGRYP